MQHSQLLFNLENQTKDFSYTIFPVKKISVGNFLKLSENCYLIILSIHILKLEISECDKSTPLKRNLVPRFEERISKEEGDKQKRCSQVR
jgi:hypothetical protein